MKSLALPWPLLLLLLLSLNGRGGLAAPRGEVDDDNDGDAAAAVADASGADEGGSPAEELESGGEGGGKGAAAGGVDVTGLQRSLDEGGVEGLNRMLQALQHVHGGDVASHIKKDAEGHEMYDFRDLGEGGQKPAEDAAGLPPRVPEAGEVSAPAGMNKRPAAGLPPHAPEAGGVTAPAGMNNRPAAGPVPRAPQASEITAPLSLNKRPPPPLPAAAAPAAAVVAVSGAIAPVMAAPASPVSPQRAAQSAPRVSTAPFATAEQSLRDQRAPGGADAAPLRSAVGAPAVTALESSSVDRVAAMAANLEHVRQEVDVLVALNSHDQSTAVEQSQPLLGRLGALEKENAKLQQELQMQAGRLEALEVAQQGEERELGKVSDENEQLRAELRHRRVFLARSERHRREGKHSGHHAVKTFFHSKAKAEEH